MAWYNVQRTISVNVKSMLLVYTQQGCYYSLS